MYSFTLLLTKEEYLEFLLYQYTQQKQIRRIRLLLHISIPALIVLIVFAAKIKNPFFIAALLLIAVVYWTFLFPALWERLATLALTKQVKNFKAANITYLFSSDTITVEQSIYRYSQLLGILPLKHEFILVLANSSQEHDTRSSLILPYRIFKNEQEKDDFVLFLEKNLTEQNKMSNKYCR